MRAIDFITPMHRSTPRDYLERVVRGDAREAVARCITRVAAVDKNAVDAVARRRREGEERVGAVRYWYGPGGRHLTVGPG